ncbi:hypothetical protein Ccr29_gp070 [Caulobacter phage Ccr29]|nr:hypothetical protein Ccr29_gp070 [Caulobacter phage Ccr29]
MNPSRRRAMLAQIETCKQSSLVVEEATKHWRRDYEAYHHVMVSGQVGRYSDEAMKALTLQASATYEALLDALRVHANNLERLRSLRGSF